MTGTERLTGKVKFFDQKKGFGFITDASGKDVFMHIGDVHGDFEPLKDDRVTYSIGQAKDGRPKAVDVRIEDAK
jgi:CspA family cold shock protein